MKTPQLFISLLSLVIASGVAQIRTFEFSASVSEISTGSPSSSVPGVSIGQSVTGWFRYDDSVAGVIDTSPGVTNRYNYDQIASAELHIGDILVSHLKQPVEIDVDNNKYDSRQQRNEDHFYYRFDTSVPQWGDIYCDVRFLDTSALAFDGFELPSAFDLTEYDIAEFYFNRNAEWFTVHCQIQEITLVPEPATLSLLVLGGVMMLRKRKLDINV